MQERVFIWVAHPGVASFNHALADAYAAGATEAGAEVRRMDLSAMSFSTDFTGYKDAPELEADLIAWQDHVRWADRVMIIHPLWWGAMPGRAKTVLDRALTPGFGYKYLKGPKVKWDKLLEGKIGDAIITADTPTWIDRWVYSKPARRVISSQVYDFCGIKPRAVRYFGSVKLSEAEQRDRWLAAAYAMGSNLSSAADRRTGTDKPADAIPAEPRAAVPA